MLALLPPESPRPDVLPEVQSAGGVVMEDDIVETVDELADVLDPPHIESEAERLGLSVDELLARVVAEVTSRLAN